MIWVKQVSTSSWGILNHIRDPMTLIFFDALDPSLWIITSCGCWMRKQLFATKKHTCNIQYYIYTLPKNHVSQSPSIWNACLLLNICCLYPKIACPSKHVEVGGWLLCQESSVCRLGWMTRMEAILWTLNLMNLHPGRLNIEPENDGLADDFSFSVVFVFSGSSR